jgi:hypothetical protein
MLYNFGILQCILLSIIIITLKIKHFIQSYPSKKRKEKILQVGQVEDNTYNEDDIATSNVRAGITEVRCTSKRDGNRVYRVATIVQCPPSTGRVLL